MIICMLVLFFYHHYKGGQNFQVKVATITHVFSLITVTWVIVCVGNLICYIPRVISRLYVYTQGER